MRPRRHVSQAERRLVDLLRRHPDGCELSFDAMAAQLDYDRRTLVSAMLRLRYHGVVTLARPGAGNRPHCYTLTAPA